MNKTSRKRYLILPAIVAVLLAAMLLPFTACEDLGYPAPASTPEAKPPAEKTVSTTINTRDDALMATYRYLLDKAVSHEAKVYLANFYAACDNWTAVSEIFKDGSGTWHVQVDMTAAPNWELRPYWQQAGWYVFRDGTVIPSMQFQANALRIEADLQQFSPVSVDKTEPENES